MFRIYIFRIKIYIHTYLYVHLSYYNYNMHNMKNVKYFSLHRTKIYLSLIGIIFEMRLLNLRINSYLLRTFFPHLGSFLCCLFFHYVLAKFHLWPSSGDLPQPRIGMLSFVTVYPVITDPTLEDQIRIYKTKKSILDRPLGPMAQRIETLSLYGSR